MLLLIHKSLDTVSDVLLEVIEEELPVAEVESEEEEIIEEVE